MFAVEVPYVTSSAGSGNGSELDAAGGKNSNQTCVFHIVVTSGSAVIVAAHHEAVCGGTAPDASTGVVFSTSRTLSDFRRYAADMSRAFEEAHLVVGCSSAGSEHLPVLCSALRRDRQAASWVAWYLNFVGGRAALAHCPWTCAFLCDPRPYEVTRVAHQSVPCCQPLTTQATGLEQQLKARLQGEKKFPIPENGARAAVVTALRHLASKVQAQIGAMTMLAAYLEKAASEHAKRRLGDVHGGKDIRGLVAKVAPVSTSLNVSVGDRVTSLQPKQDSGVVMYVGPSGGKKGDAVVGVSWDDPSAGSSDGSFNGVKRFHCGATQGTFDRPASLFRDLNDDATLGAIVATFEAIDVATKAAADEALSHAATTAGALSFYVSFLQAAHAWLSRLCTLSFTMETAEAWLVAQTNKKNACVEKELHIEELIAAAARQWEIACDAFKSEWAQCSALRSQLTLFVARCAVTFFGCLDKLDIDVTVHPASTREEIAAMFRELHLD